MSDHMQSWVTRQEVPRLPDGRMDWPAIYALHAAITNDPDYSGPWLDVGYNPLLGAHHQHNQTTPAADEVRWSGQRADFEALKQRMLDISGQAPIRLSKEYRPRRIVKFLARTFGPYAPDRFGYDIRDPEDWRETDQLDLLHDPSNEWGAGTPVKPGTVLFWDGEAWDMDDEDEGDDE